MKALFARALASPWLLALCLLLYVGFVGPQLISATDTLAVIVGLIVLGLLAAWSYRLLRRSLRHKE
ncbi:hypothetical protein RKE25_21985 [Dyella sp. BiH032]|uniref:hypothetical protein n=1 Tax=Dyella sp. BiH032 TaxID=3075430 RepID=UPI00289353B4|nr:hypothetical protein [Dyella sp. BiH032]WNL46047.1 hypothetical protein RKE25_21985 [Dyella sp. BiH032]